jgi:diguanylate cyclase (GGDEF)-like protein
MAETEIDIQLEVDKITEILDFAFQPIVSVHSGILMAVEALLRNYNEAGFSSIDEVFDYAYNKSMLYQLDLSLRNKLLKKYSQIKMSHEFKLFYNLDNRVLLMPDYQTGNTTELLKFYNIRHNLFCFEISEKSPLHTNISMKKILTNYKNQNFYIAIDDYGVGFSGLQQLYNTEPDFLKIDRFFIHNINLDQRKKKVVSSVVDLAHVIGMQVIAEGVETAEEFSACKEIGCEYVQGYFVQRPTLNVDEINEQLYHIRKLNKRDLRRTGNDVEIINTEMQRYEPVLITESNVEDIFNYFRKHSHRTFVPVVNKLGSPVGIVMESRLKKYVYSPYGKELLRGKKSKQNIRELISSAPVCEISTSVEELIDIFNLNRENFGVLLTENGRYSGFLTAKSLLKLINKKNIAFARNQNPLTKLPGNTVITEKISMLDKNPKSVVCYFDFDFFKPFNDKYGFRTGDRAIMMFADILNMYETSHNCFIGHIGGDDFVMIEYDVEDIEKVKISVVELIVQEFKRNVENLYNDEDRKAGCISGTDRFGIKREFPLLTVSCVMADVMRHINPENIPFEIAEKKKEVKTSNDPVIVF